AAAYRGALCLTDARTGIVHNYQTRSGVQRVFCISPIGAPDWTEDPQQLWSAVEAAEKRKDSTVAREFEMAL
ncbi:MobA/MobL family protein, partial [Klebsiella sp. K47]